MTDDRLSAMARKVIDANVYLTLATADAEGRPWASPVYFTAVGYTEIYWVSSPDARHSRNIAARPDVGIVVFDSRAAVGTAEAVYLAARAEQVTEPDLERCAGLYSGRHPAPPGSRSIGPDELRGPALFRLYRATVTEHSVLVRGRDPELGTGVDSRMRVTLP
jgi:hypothetical protein